MSDSLPLHRLAHARAGDKGNRLNIALICYRPESYALLAEQVSETRVAGLFADRGVTEVRRYDLPNLHAFNFVLDHALDGGVNASLGLDGHGKTLSFLLLTLPVRLPAGFALHTEQR
ncbi:MAG: hypothetical protein ACK4FK_10220 [Ferrovibrio sp.]|jgi:hypothetical protein|uniref:AtuA-related protein n=1 Tax=Ferrovibrio sp. TaxID=1917215 RepID=UPI00391AF44D